MPLYHTRLQPLFHLSVHSWNVVNHNLKFEHLTQKNRLLGGFSEKGGPSDRIRTCGILLPKQARYQLRYTRLLSYFIRLVVFSQIRVARQGRIGRDGAENRKLRPRDLPQRRSNSTAGRRPQESPVQSVYVPVAKDRRDVRSGLRRTDSQEAVREGRD